MLSQRLLKMTRLVSKKIYNKQQCMQTILKTTSQVQKVTEITLGPYGRNVLIETQMHAPRITKDGITVVKHLQFENRMEDAVATLIKKSVDGTNKFAGDGTTTSTVLIGQIMRIGYRRIAAGANPRDIRKGFEIGRRICIDFLESCARKITKKQQLMNVAMISTNGKVKIAELVVEAVYNGKTVKVQKSKKSQNSIEYHSGLSIPQGTETREFLNSKQQKVIYNYPMVVTSLLPIKNIKDVINSLQLAKKARKQIIIFCPQVSDSVKNTLIYNNIKKVLQCCSVNLPAYSDKSQQYIKKISNLCQSYLFTQFSDDKIEKIDWKHFGKATKVEVNLYQTIIQVQDKNNKKNVQAVIMVGGPNQTVMLENYDHIIDALNSTKSAIKDGVVAGGGVTFWRLSQLLQSYSGQGEEGVRILAEALKQPRKKLMQYVPPQNRPLSGSQWQGYDLKQQKIVDMFDAGIIDSVNVAKSAIIDSLSLCSVLIEVEVGLARIDKNTSQISLKELNDQHKI